MTKILTNKLLPNILVAIFALSLLSGVAVAQTDKKPAATPTAAAARRRSARHQYGHQGTTRRSAGNWSGLFAENYRWPSLCEENRPDEEESSSRRHLRQDQRQDHRQTEVNGSLLIRRVTPKTI